MSAMAFVSRFNLPNTGTTIETQHWISDPISANGMYRLRHPAGEAAEPRNIPKRSEQPLNTGLKNGCSATSALAEMAMVR